MASDIHGDFEPYKRWHGKGYGCVWRHDHPFDFKTKKYKDIEGSEECCYRNNGFDISKNSRSDLYNGNHKEKAKNEGYFKDKERIREDVRVQSKKKRRGKIEEKRWKTMWHRRLGGPIDLLKQDPKAWHIGHTYAGTFMPWWRTYDRKKQTTDKENFLPLTHGGLYYLFPYEHNYHHLIATGAFRTIVLNAPIPEDSDITPQRRLAIVLCKKYLHWNISNKDNIILLPNAEIHAEIVGLPAHCPWDRPCHPDYTDMIKNKLKEVKMAIDKAVGTEDHEDSIEIAKDTIEKTQEKLLKKVKKLKKL